MKKQNITTLHQIISGRYVSPKQRDNQQDYSTLQDKEKNHISQIIKDKYKTFTKWNIRSSLPQSPRRKKALNKSVSGMASNSSIAMGISKLMPGIKNNKSLLGPEIDKKSDEKDEKMGNRKIGHRKSISENPKLPPAIKHNKNIAPQTKDEALSAEQMGVKSERRQRFKKVSNPMQFIKHYMQKQNYKPTAEQKHLLERLVGVQKMMEGVSYENMRQNILQDVLQKIYKLMNLAVDYNQLLFLSLVILLAADICYYLKDFNRSFYFYNQVRIAGSYAHLDKLKVSALLGMGKIAEQLQFFTEAKRVFKKALQYVWRVNSQDSELQIYDLYGQILHYEGRTKESKFYHVRFAHNILQPQNSALKRISSEMLTDYDNYIRSLEHSDVNSLFIEYLNLPINNNIDVKAKTDKIFKNYGQGGVSPRKKKEQQDFSRQNFMKIDKQLQILLNQDPQFKIQMAQPDGYDDPSLKTRKSFYNPNSHSPKKELDFQHSIVFNRITGKKPSKPNIEKVLKLPLEIQIQKKLNDKLDPSWYEIMVKDIKKRRLEKVGDLKERVRKSHLSYHKYPSERKKSNIWSSEKINESFNRTILDWIDPVM